MNYVRQTPTEECPLTKEKQKCSISDCCGFRSIICSFVALTVVITSALVLQLVYDDNAFQGSLNIHGAVATDNTNCSQIGTKILRKGGNALDAAVSATLCMAVVSPHKTGLGSGGYIMIYNHKDQENPIIIDFLNNTIPDEFESIQIRIPALLRGLEYAHSMHGKLSWQEIVEPAAILARKGFEISRDFANEVTKNIYLGTFQHISAGQFLTLPKLADTLEAVSKLGTKVFYNGTITDKIFEKNPTNEKLFYELANYEPKIVKPQKSELSNYAIFYPPTDNFIQQVVDEINNQNISMENASAIETEITTAESLIKLARQMKIPYHNFENKRYTGVSSVDWQDIYVSIVTGLSSQLNFTNVTEAGFFLDHAENNNALQSLSPIIFYDEAALCGLRGVFGADDAIVVGEILYNLLLRSMNVSAAVEYRRFYVLSDGIALENDDRYLGDRLLYDSLLSIDTISKVNSNMLMKSINVIIKRQNLINAHSDSRGDALASRF